MKKITYKIVSICTVVLLAAFIFSCSDDYLDFEPVAAKNEAAFYLTMEHAELAVTAAYAALSHRTAWDRNITMVLGDVTSDDAEAGGDFENEVPAEEEFNRFTYFPTSGILEEVYGVMFRGIHFANKAMENIPNVLETDEYADSAIINIRIAELKFLRALNYMYLTSIFGEVPLVDHVLAPSEYNMDKATLIELYDLIEKDLLEAIPVLPERSGLSEKDLGRATKGAAQALLARKYLFESSYVHYYPGDERFTGLNERWQDALDMCKNVINSGLYDLVGQDGEKYNTWRGPLTNGYSYIFTVEGENSPESVFSIQYINDGKIYTLSRAGSLVQWVSARYYTDANGNQIQTPYWGLGWPTQSLVNEYDPQDVRLHVNVSMLGDSIQIANDRTVLVNFDNSATGYYMKKYELSADQFADAPGHSWHKSPFNIMLIRYADVILMAGEASFMLGNNAQARDYINQVRTRARVCGDGVVPADYPDSYTIGLDDIIKERRMELALEGRRFSDMVRWNIAKGRLNDTETPGGFPIVYESPKNDFMPIPQREIITSNGGITQHEGW
jgi:hypothetical protein